MRSFNFASFAATATFVTAFLAHLPVLRVAGVAFALLALACLIVHEVKKRRMTTELLTHVTAGAERARNERLAREYQRYLVDAS